MAELHWINFEIRIGGSLFVIGYRRPRQLFFGRQTVADIERALGLAVGGLKRFPGPGDFVDREGRISR